MDMKASARAKHASSQRGRARHSTRKQPVVAQEQRAASNTSQQPPHSKALSLPSNWNRYEEEDSSIQEASLSQVSAAKSKGANYSDLLSEKSMYQASDLAPGRKRLMSSRGLDLWARLLDVDNFGITHASSGEEDSFFSLDLNLLSEELAKVDVAERLSVDQKYIISYEEKIKNEMQCKELTSRTSNETMTLEIASPAAVPASPLAYQVRSQQSNPLSTGATGEPSICLHNHVSEIPYSKILSQSQEGMSKETMTNLSKRASMFEAKAAEAELDALLDMFDTHKIGEDMSTLSAPTDLEPAKSLVSTSLGSCPDNFTKSSSMDLGRDFFSKTGARANVPDVLSGVNMPTQGPVVANAISSQGLSAGVLDDDLDDWLDSL